MVLQTIRDRKLRHNFSSIVLNVHALNKIYKYIFAFTKSITIFTFTSLTQPIRNLVLIFFDLKHLDRLFDSFEFESENVFVQIRKSNIFYVFPRRKKWKMSTKVCKCEKIWNQIKQMEQVCVLTQSISSFESSKLSLSSLLTPFSTLNTYFVYLYLQKINEMESFD